jgi:hypothetical protein
MQTSKALDKHGEIAIVDFSTNSALFWEICNFEKHQKE